MGSKNLNIQLLIEGCLRGNRGSQRGLYSHYYGYAMNISMRYSRNKAEAEEILNDGFLRVFKNLERYDPAYPFQVWLRTLLIASAIDYHRKYHKQKPFLELSTIQEPSETDTAYESLDGIDVLPLVQKLPPAYRMVFNLYVMEGYKHHEIAEKLDISVGASKSNLARAKAKLRGWMEVKKVKH